MVNGEGNGTPLQYSCLENPMDGGAWWAAVHGVAKSRTRLSDLSFTFPFHALEKVKGLGSACMHAGPPHSHTYGAQVLSDSRAKAPGNLSRRLQIKGKHTFGYDTANSLTTTYSLNYNSVSCCKLFRAHKHHNKTSLQPQIHTENLHIIPVSLRREGKHGFGKSSQWQALGCVAKVRDHLTVTV